VLRVVVEFSTCVQVCEITGGDGGTPR